MKNKIFSSLHNYIIHFTLPFLSVSKFWKKIHNNWWKLELQKIFDENLFISKFKPLLEKISCALNSFLIYKNFCLKIRWNNILNFFFSWYLKKKIFFIINYKFCFKRLIFWKKKWLRINNLIISEKVLEKNHLSILSNIFFIKICLNFFCEWCKFTFLLQWVDILKQNCEKWII